MTKAQEINLEGVAEGVANLASAYEDVTDKVLTPSPLVVHS